MFLMYHYESSEINQIEVNNLNGCLGLTIDCGPDQITLFMTPDQIEYLISQTDSQLQDLSQVET